MTWDILHSEYIGRASFRVFLFVPFPPELVEGLFRCIKSS